MTMFPFDPPDDHVIPEPEPDATDREITLQPVQSESSATTVARDIATHLTHLLNTPVTRVALRENPWGRRRCPVAWFYDVTCGGHHIRITAFETRHPLLGDLYTTHAVFLDGQRIPFHRTLPDGLVVQLARAIWQAHQALPTHEHQILSDDKSRS
jgi:hypothetical protein